MRAYAATDKGPVRELNEDSYFISPERHICAVADGMGGHNAGEVASALAIDVFKRELENTSLYTVPILRSAVERANQEINECAEADPDKSGMGTTFTALAFSAGRAMIVHVGDSRAYLIRKRSIMQLSVDHTLVEELLESGAITVREARIHPHRNYITRALGTDSHVKVDGLYVDLKQGDVFMLCSDGLSGSVSDIEMMRLLQSEKNLSAVPQKLVEMAIEKGGRDNITCILVSTDGEVM